MTYTDTGGCSHIRSAAISVANSRSRFTPVFIKFRICVQTSITRETSSTFEQSPSTVPGVSMPTLTPTTSLILSTPQVSSWGCHENTKTESLPTISGARSGTFTTSSSYTAPVDPKIAAMTLTSTITSSQAALTKNLMRAVVNQNQSGRMVSPGTIFFFSSCVQSSIHIINVLMQRF